MTDQDPEAFQVTPEKEKGNELFIVAVQWNARKNKLTNLTKKVHARI